MTREKAKEIISYHRHLVDKEKSGLLDKELEYQAIDMAIKALEQELILDKIRAEIDSTKVPKNQMSFFRDGINCALQIIDKYKGKSEDKK